MDYISVSVSVRARVRAWVAGCMGVWACVCVGVYVVCVWVCGAISTPCVVVLAVACSIGSLQSRRMQASTTAAVWNLSVCVASEKRQAYEQIVVWIE